MHCLTTQTVEHPSFFLHANLVFQLEEKRKTYSVCKHCILNLLICELQCLQFATTQIDLWTFSAPNVRTFVCKVPIAVL